jgi:hypothetical protein
VTGSCAAASHDCVPPQQNPTVATRPACFTTAIDAAMSSSTFSGGSCFA